VGSASAVTVAGWPPTGAESALALRDAADVVTSVPNARMDAAAIATPRSDTRDG
jgi:hypothetical protein